MSDAAVTSKQLLNGTYKPVKIDPRFPNQNQTRRCYQYYIDFHRCEKARGKGDSSCKEFKRTYETVCPLSWINRMDTQMAENKFPGKI